MTDERGEYGSAGKGRVIWKKAILAKSNFNLRGDAKWKRDYYMDIAGIRVCIYKSEREKGEKLKKGKQKERELESLVMGRQG